MDRDAYPARCSPGDICRKSVRRIAMVLGWLVVLDIALLTVRSLWPHSPLAAIALNQRSLESRIRQGFDDAGRPKGGPASLVFAGWADPTRSNYRWTEESADGRLRVSVYGMSFSSDVGRALRDVASDWTIRLIDAPSSTASHSLAMAEVDSEPGDVAVLGVLSSQVYKEGSMIGALISTGNLAPFTSPSMIENPDGSWTRTQPAIRSLDEFGRAIVARDERWRQFVSQMRTSDPLYSSFVFETTWLDHSFVAGLLRRAWDRSIEDGAKADRLERRADGTSVASRVIDEVVGRFVAIARARGECPVVMAIRTFRDPEDVCASVVRACDRLGVPVLCTDMVVDWTDSSNFKPDLHYTDQACLTMAEALRSIVAESCAEASR
jgi:hypothetical protein